MFQGTIPLSLRQARQCQMLAVPMTRCAPSVDAIIAKVEAQPDITMPDLAAWLETQHSVSADPSNLSKLLCRAGFTYKKNFDGRGTRTRRRPPGTQ